MIRTLVRFLFCVLVGVAFGLIVLGFENLYEAVTRGA